jgi:hypothetical protein
VRARNATLGAPSPTLTGQSYVAAVSDPHDTCLAAPWEGGRSLVGFLPLHRLYRQISLVSLGHPWI